MKAASLLTLMQRNDLRVADVAALLGRTERIVQLWLAGSQPVPRAITLILSALDQKMVTEDWLIRQMRS